MIYLPDTNACISILRNRHAGLVARWRGLKPSELILCSVVVYELRFGAERSSDAAREHAKLDTFLAPYACLAFDEESASQCARIRYELETAGLAIGPYDLQIAAIAVQRSLTIVTHNIKEFGRVSGLSCEDWET